MTPQLESLWRFAAERHAMLERRLRGEPPPWTQDLVLRDHKFTNVFRLADRVTQYLLRHVIYEGDQTPQEVVFRTLLFKVFNRIDTWEELVAALGRQPSWARFDIARYAAILAARQSRGDAVYTAAYYMTGGSRKGEVMHVRHLGLVAHMMSQRVAERAVKTRSMRELFVLLRSFYSVGDFLAWQYALDINYSNMTDHDESECVVLGPGAVEGLRKLGLPTTEDAVVLLYAGAPLDFDELGLAEPRLCGRPLQLVDVEHLLCEWGKYARVAHPELVGKSGGGERRTTIKQPFDATTREPLEPIFLPPKWR